MRILILANAKAVHTQRWASALAARGHEVTLASMRAVEIPGVETVCFGVGGSDAKGKFAPLLGYFRLALGLRGLLRRVKPDVVNPHYAVTHGVIAALGQAHPRVVNLWGSDVIWEGDGPMPFWRRWLVRLGIEGADVLASTSQFMLDATAPMLNRTPETRIVPFGVDCERFHLEPPAPPSEDVTIGWVKTFNQKYAPEVFVTAAALAAKTLPDLRFVMAGRGPDLAAVQAQAAASGLAGRISFPGFVPNAEVPALMRSFDILVNSSRRESFGVVLLEGAACGLPVISVDVGGVREAMIGGETGLLAPVDDPAALAEAMVTLGRDAALRAKMGAAGRRFVAETYPWDKCVEMQEAAFQRAIDRHRAGRGR